MWSLQITRWKFLTGKMPNVEEYIQSTFKIKPPKQWKLTTNYVRIYFETIKYFGWLFSSENLYTKVFFFFFFFRNCLIYKYIFVSFVSFIFNSANNVFNKVNVFKFIVSHAFIIAHNVNSLEIILKATKFETLSINQANEHLEYLEW